MAAVVNASARGAGLGGQMMLMDSGEGLAGYSSNDLWLEIVTVTNAITSQTAYFLVHTPETNGVYDLFLTTNLSPNAQGLNLTNWLWVLRTEPGQTNLVVTNLTADQCYFMLGTTNDTDGDGLSDAFEKLASHSNPTNADTYGNGLPDGWQWNNFGNFNQTASGDYDGDGTNNLAEYQAGTDPNTITFALSVTNQYVNINPVPVQLNVMGGVPSTMAVLVDSTNFAAANWTAYSSNLTVNLGTNEGWHQVRVGLRGRLAASQQTWQWKRLKLDLKPPLLAITNPVSPNVSQPMIQLQGCCPEPLSCFTFDATNAAGLTTNELVLITDQTYDTNTWEFTTNYFQCFDVELTNGVNTITLHATDYAGNVTATNFSFTLVSDTNPPVISLSWPQDGARVSGTNFTWRGRLDDFTATLMASMVDTNGTTNTFEGLVERSGDFWVENLPLPGGTNAFTLTATDVWGNASTTNITVVKSDLVLTVGNVTAGDTNVNGTISVTNYTVWVNGVKVTNYVADGLGGYDWQAERVPMAPTLGGTIMVQARAIPNSDNGGNGSAGNGSGNGGSADNNPASTQAVDAEQEIAAPEGIYVSAYQQHQRLDDYDHETNLANAYEITEGWRDSAGGNYHDVGYFDDGSTYFDTAWDPSWWPQEPPLGILQYNGQPPGYEGGLPDRVKEHCDVNWSFPRSDGSGRIASTLARTADAEMTLATGGKARPGSKSLWVITATANAITNKGGWFVNVAPLTEGIAPERIAIGTLGHLGSDGKLYVVLPDGDPDTITPKVSGNDIYIYPAPSAGIVQLRSLNVVSGATQIDSTNWAAVKTPTNDWVYVQATLSTDDTNAANFIQWSGGQAVPGNPFQHRVTKTASAETTVTATLGSTNKSLNVWILWGTMDFLISGTNPSNAPPHPAFVNDNTQTLGVRFQINSNAACGRITEVGTITPAGVHAVITNGWQITRERMSHDFNDGTTNALYYDTTWQSDGPNYQTTVPDNNDKLYSIDGPVVYH